jgi:hypothetical protein
MYEKYSSGSQNKEPVVFTDFLVKPNKRTLNNFDFVFQPAFNKLVDSRPTARSVTIIKRGKVVMRSIGSEWGMEIKPNMVWSYEFTNTFPRYLSSKPKTYVVRVKTTDETFNPGLLSMGLFSVSLVDNKTQKRMFGGALSVTMRAQNIQPLRLPSTPENRKSAGMNGGEIIVQDYIVRFNVNSFRHKKCSFRLHVYYAGSKVLQSGMFKLFSRKKIEETKFWRGLVDNNK